MKSYVIIKTFASLNELAIVRKQLEKEGIETFTNEDIAEENGEPYLFEDDVIELKVRDYDEKLALIFLNGLGGSKTSLPELSGFWKRFLAFHYEVSLLNRLNPLYGFIAIVSVFFTLLFCVFF